MPLPFDATLKDLARRHPADYVSTFRLGDPSDIRALNVDLSVISAATDVALGHGDPLRSVAASLRAGECASAVAAHEEAKTHCERALATLDQAGLEAPEERYRAWMGAGDALYHQAAALRLDPEMPEPYKHRGWPTSARGNTTARSPI